MVEAPARALTSPALLSRPLPSPLTGRGGRKAARIRSPAHLIIPSFSFLFPSPGEGGREGAGEGLGVRVWAGALLLLLLAACGADLRGSGPPPAAEKVVPVLAIRAPDDLSAELRAGGFFRWGIPRLSGLRVEVGPQASGDAEVWLERLPASPETLARIAGLPVQLAGEAIVLGGVRYGDAGQALAVRVPGAEKPTWIVAGRGGEALIDLADEVLFRLAASLADQPWGRRRAPLEFDYLVRQTPWMERSGRWMRTDAGYAVDPAERDDLAEWDRRFAALAPVRGEWITLLVSPGERERPELARLAAELDRAVSEMAPRVPVSIASPLTVVVEPDHVAQGRHAGEIGEAVPGTRADLHLVFHPADISAYRYALAGALLARAGLRGKAPIAMERGAALWLSRDWYGRPFPDRLPLLAAARVLPEAKDLLTAEEPRDASTALWTPAAAAVIERLPGRTVIEKLDRLPSAERTGEILNSLRVGAGLDGGRGLDPPWSPPRFASPSPSRPAPTRNASSSSFLKGVSLAMANSLEHGYHSPTIRQQLDRLSAMGANAVSLMPFASQPGPDRPELRFLNRGPGSETDIGLIHATRLARARGFHVLYKPHLWISGGSWPGDVRMKSEADWMAWWRGYRRYILHHALLARWAGADLFSVGVELSLTVDREAEWRDLIAAVRLFFPGTVTYSGNWYGDLDSVRFWDVLDVIGVDAYFPLAGSPRATRVELERGAEAIADRLAAASRRFGRPVLLTEVGFAARRGAWVAPYTEGGEYSEDDQALAYQALFKALGRRPWLAGTFVWKAFSAEGTDGGGDADFGFLGRKAEGVVREYYGGGS
jgi:glycosyl hydrolase family 113